MAIKFQKSVFSFHSDEHGDILVTYQEAGPGFQYRWDVNVKINGQWHSWNCRPGPSRTAALHLISSTLKLPSK
jgi:hypothetical protein